MQLTLDHTQRLNLHALLGAQRADVGSFARSGQSRIASLLDADEEEAVELKREMVGGQEVVVWNRALSIPARDFEFTDPEVARIKAALQTWDGYGATADRRWLGTVTSPPIQLAAYDNWQAVERRTIGH